MFGFLIAVAAGFVTPQLQHSAVPAVAKTLSALKITRDEYPVVAVLLAALVAGLVAAVFDSGSALGTVFGVTLGYFGRRLIKIVKDATSGAPRP